jgi:hypothetical protein
MKQAFSFARLEARMNRAAQDGAAEAADRFAQTLRANGEQASVTAAPEGTAQIVLEGAAAVAREFGTRTVPPRPAAADALSASRRDIREAIARKVAAALKGAHS